MISKQKIALFAVSATLTVLAGCKSMVEARRDAQTTTETVTASADAIYNGRPRAEPVKGPLITDLPYVDVRSMPRTPRFPASFARESTFNFPAGTTLANAALRISQTLGVRMVYESELDHAALAAGTSALGGSLPAAPQGPGSLAGAVDAVTGGLTVPVSAVPMPTTTFSVAYSGNAEGLFNKIAEATNSSWEYVEGSNTVFFYRYKVETFRLPASQSKSSYIAKMGAAAASVGNQPVSTAEATAAHETSGNVWDEIKTTLAQLVSVEGKVSVSPSTGTITVRDRPDRIEAIRSYMQRTADALSRQVDIDVTVYRVLVNDADSRSVNLGLAFRNMLGHYLITSAGTGMRSDVVGEGLSSLIISVPETDSSGRTQRYGGSQLIMDTLSRLGRDVAVTNTSIQTANMQPAQTKITKRKPYIKGVAQNVTSAGGALNSTGPTITQDIYETGLTLYALPHVMDDGKRLMLEMTASLATLESMSREGTNESYVQQPEIAARDFDRKVWLNAGETLVLAGFEQTDAGLNTQSPIDRRIWPLGGNSRASKGREFVVITIHPTVSAVRSRI